MSVPLLEIVPDGVNELDSVVVIVGEDESVPDPECVMETVPHGVAEKETDTVPHALADGDTDCLVEPDELVVPLLHNVAEAQ